LNPNFIVSADFISERGGGAGGIAEIADSIELINPVTSASVALCGILFRVLFFFADLFFAFSVIVFAVLISTSCTASAAQSVGPFDISILCLQSVEKAFDGYCAGDNES